MPQNYSNEDKKYFRVIPNDKNVIKLKWKKIHL